MYFENPLATNTLMAVDNKLPQARVMEIRGVRHCTWGHLVTECITGMLIRRAYRKSVSAVPASLSIKISNEMQVEGASTRLLFSIGRTVLKASSS